LVERRSELGGRLGLVRGLGRAAELFRSIDWLEEELRELGVDVRTGVEAGEATVSDADVVVLATGSRPAPDRLVGADDGTIPVLSIDEAVTRASFEGPVLFADLRGDIEAALAAEHAAAVGAELTLVTPYLTVGPNLGFTHLADVMARYVRLGCTLEPSTTFGGIAEGRAVTRHVYTKEIRSRPFAAVVAGVHGRSETSLEPAVERAGVRLIVAGDAVAPRTALHAFREGDDAGRAA
jgi:hypothetical protein